MVETTVADSDSDVYSIITCTALSNLTGVNVSLTSGQDPVHVVFNSTSVSQRIIKNDTNSSCSVWYNSETIWTGIVFKEGKEENILSYVVTFTCDE